MRLPLDLYCFNMLKNHYRDFKIFCRSSTRALKTKAFSAFNLILTYDIDAWIIDYMGKELVSSLNNYLNIGRFSPTEIRYARKKLIHFLGQFDCFNKDWVGKFHSSNKMIGLWWHGSASSSAPKIKAAFETIPIVSKELSKIQVTCSISKQALISQGIGEDKIVFLPLGINLMLFKPPSNKNEINSIKESLGIPRDYFCIGLFQKDGIGWKEGLEPKLVKGPDIFLSVIKELFSKFPIFVLIPGPARGYLKKGLEEAGIPYRCDGHIELKQIAHYYHACDLYIIPSREEGGPSALLESMATGVPLVSTNVGMASDLIQNGINGFLVNTGDVKGLVERAIKLLRNSALRQKFSEAGLKTIQKFSWDVLAPEYYKGLYLPLLSGLRQKS